MKSVGRRGFLKGLAALTGTTLAGSYVVDSPRVVEAKDLALPLRDLVVPEAPQIIVAQHLPREVAQAEMMVQRWSVDVERDLLRYGSDGALHNVPGPASGTLALQGALVGTPADWESWLKVLPGNKVRVYFEVVED